MSMIKKIFKLQQELKAPKDEINKFGGYKYRTAEKILELAKPILAKHELAIFLSDELMLIGDRYYVKASATISDGEHMHTCTAFAREALSQKGKDDSQITGSASTYARKYALSGLLAIDSGEKDADEANTHQEDDAVDVKKAIKTCKSKDELTNLFKSLPSKVKADEKVVAMFTDKASDFEDKPLTSRI